MNRLENISEIDCFVKSFLYLSSKMSASEFLRPFVEDCLAEPLVYMSFTKIENSSSYDVKFEVADIDAALDRYRKKSDRSLIDDDDSFPCMLAMCGSAFGYLQVFIECHFRPW